MRSLSLQLVKKFSYCYETRKFISVRKSWSVERGESIHNVTSYLFNSHFNIMGEERKVYRVLVKTPKERDHLEDQGIDGMRMDFTVIGWGVWNGYSWLTVGAGGGIL
jgi:hypothetical protein